MVQDYGQSELKGNIIQAALLVLGVLLIIIGMSLMNGCSQEIGSRYEVTVTDPNNVTTTETYTDFKFNYFLFDRDWKNFKYRDMAFDELNGESKSVEVDLLQQKGSVK